MDLCLELFATDLRLADNCDAGHVALRADRGVCGRRATTQPVRGVHKKHSETAGPGLSLALLLLAVLHCREMHPPRDTGHAF